MPLDAVMARVRLPCTQEVLVNALPRILHIGNLYNTVMNEMGNGAFGEQNDKLAGSWSIVYNPAATVPRY